MLKAPESHIKHVYPLCKRGVLEEVMPEPNAHLWANSRLIASRYPVNGKLPLREFRETNFTGGLRSTDVF